MDDAFGDAKKLWSALHRRGKAGWLIIHPTCDRQGWPEIP